MSKFTRSQWVVVALVLLSLVLRLGLAVKGGIGAGPEAGTDEQEYDSYAWNVAQGNGYRGISPDVSDGNHLTAYRPPGPSLVWAGCYAVFGHRYDVVRVVNCLAGALSVVFVYGMGRMCFGERAGVWSAAAWAVWPVGLLFSAKLYSEPLGVLLFTWFLWLCLRFGERPTWGRAVWAGVMLGLTLLTRPNPMFMVPLLGVWAVWQFRKDKAAMVRGLAVPAVAVLTMSPWVVRNYVVFHRFIPISTMGGSCLLQGNNRIVATDPELYGSSIWDTRIPEYRDALRAPNDEVGRDDVAKRLAKRWILDNLGEMPRMVVNKVIRGWTPVLRPHTARLYRWGTLLSWGPVLVLFLIGFVPTWVGFLRSGHPGWVLHLGIVSSLVLTVILFGELRYRYVFEPICIVIAAGVVARAVGAVRRRVPSAEVAAASA